MAFAYSTVIQNRIAEAVWNGANSTLSAAQKAQMDATWTTGALAGGVALDAWHELSQIAQWFEQSSDTSFLQPAWNRLFVATAAMLLVKTVRPDRHAAFVADREAAYDAAIDTFTNTLISTTSLGGQGTSIVGIRSSVIDHCVKRVSSGTGLRRRLFPTIAQIDGHIQWTLNFLWNFKPWHFRKRQVTVRITTADISTATWTESTKTLTQTGLFTNTNIAAGDRVIITGGTSVYEGEYLVTSRTSDDAIVLDTSLSSTAGNLTAADITGSLSTVTLRGMGTSETFDSIVSRKLFYQGDQAGSELRWVDSSDMSEWKARENEGLGQPCEFRFEKINFGDTRLTTWHLSPFPDADYTMRGAALISGPADVTTEASLVTAIAKFPAEFRTVIRDVVLARTLQGFAASDGDSMMRSAMDQVEVLLPIYADQGFPTRRAAVIDDVYNDYGAML